MKFWHSGGALPVALGVAFHLSQPLHPSSLSIRHVFLMISQKVCEVMMELVIYAHCLISLIKHCHSPSQRSICDFGLVSGSRFIAFSGTRARSRLPLLDRLDTLGYITSAEESASVEGDHIRPLLLLLLLKPRASSDQTVSDHE